MTPNFLAFECIRLFLNVLKWLLGCLAKVIEGLLVFGNRVMLPVPYTTFLIDQNVICLSSQKHHFQIVQFTFRTFAQLELVKTSTKIRWFSAEIFIIQVLKYWRRTPTQTTSSDTKHVCVEPAVIHHQTTSSCCIVLWTSWFFCVLLL